MSAENLSIHPESAKKGIEVSLMQTKVMIKEREDQSWQSLLSELDSPSYVEPRLAPSIDGVPMGWFQRQMTYSRIAGTGSYAPENKLTNRDLEQMVDTSDVWIQSRTGIQERRIARKDQAASDLAAEAAQKALKAAGLLPDDIDLIVVATVTPDTMMPSTACWLQAKLQCKRAMAFDVSAACSGFVYALSVADNFIRAGSAQSALVVGVDTFSKIMNYQDRNTCVLFGDGAGAVVLEATTGDSHILSTHLFSDGAYADILEVPAGGSRMPATQETVDQRLHTMVMRNGQEVFKSAVRSMSEAIQHALEQNDLTVEDVDLLIPHQANIRIIEAVGQKLGLSSEKVFTNLHHYGNTSAASIPLALDEAVRADKIKSGDVVALAAFGAGFTWGSAIVRWG